MNKYIPAEKLIAEIEKRQEARQDTRDSASWENEYWPEGDFCTRDDEDDAILSIINSLQQEEPEVKPLTKLEKAIFDMLVERTNEATISEAQARKYAPIFMAIARGEI